MPSQAEIQDFLSRFEGRVAPADKAGSEAWWRLATTGTEEAREELVRAGISYNEVFAAGDEFGRIRGWYGGRGSLESPLLRRQVEVLYSTFAGRQGDREVLDRIE